MGIAILSGILASLNSLRGPRPLQSDPSAPAEEVPSSLPTRFIACVRTPATAKRVKKELWQHTSCVKVVQKDNVAAVQRYARILDDKKVTDCLYRFLALFHEMRSVLP